MHLCTTVDHYSGTFGDKGWGCGYRYVYRDMLLLSRNWDKNPYFSCSHLLSFTTERVEIIKITQNMPPGECKD